jgi:hypothetical protein
MLDSSGSPDIDSALPAALRLLATEIERAQKRQQILKVVQYDVERIQENRG